MHRQFVRNFYVFKPDIARHGVTLGCKECSFMFSGAKSSVRRSDERRQRIMEAREADEEGRMRTFLDKNVSRRPAPEIAGGGGAALAVVAPAAAVRTVEGAPSRSLGRAQTSPMEVENEESTRAVQRRQRQVFLNSDRRREADSNHPKNPIKTGERA